MTGGRCEEVGGRIFVDVKVNVNGKFSLSLS